MYSRLAFQLLCMAITHDTMSRDFITVLSSWHSNYG